MVITSDWRFEFRTIDGAAVTGTNAEAHAALIAYAKANDLSLHIHGGSWAGNAVSTAARKGEDALFGAVACVKVISR